MDSYQSERRELLESILDALAVAEPDDDRAAACLQLLRHLIGSGRRRVRVGIS